MYIGYFSCVGGRALTFFRILKRKITRTLGTFLALVVVHWPFLEFYRAPRGTLGGSWVTKCHGTGPRLSKIGNLNNQRANLSLTESVRLRLLFDFVPYSHLASSPFLTLANRSTFLLPDVLRFPWKASNADRRPRRSYWQVIMSLASTLFAVKSFVGRKTCT